MLNCFMSFKFLIHQENQHKWMSIYLNSIIIFDLHLLLIRRTKSFYTTLNFWICAQHFRVIFYCREKEKKNSKICEVLCRSQFHCYLWNIRQFGGRIRPINFPFRFTLLISKTNTGGWFCASEKYAGIPRWVKIPAEREKTQNPKY